MGRYTYKRNRAPGKTSQSIVQGTTLKKCIKSMPRRIKDLIEATGGHTKY